jgi:hypothetical protein
MAPLLPVRAGVALVLALPLAACNGTPIGDRLSESFPQPPAGDTPAAPRPAPSAGAAGGIARGTAAPATGPQPGAGPAPTAPVVPAQRPTTLPPAPYRLVLRLPAADPAAPAEAVTEALRAAGLSFEVETIERMPAAVAPAQPPVATPAPAVAPAAPAAQPAQTPR